MIRYGRYRIGKNLNEKDMIEHKVITKWNEVK